MVQDGQTGTWDLYGVSASGGKKELLAGGPNAQMEGRISPDGRWLAYTSDEAGFRPVFITGLGPVKGKWQVASSAAEPRWRADGKELVFTDISTGMLQTVTVQADTAGVVLGKAVPLFRVRSGIWEITPDFQRILAVDSTEADARSPIIICKAGSS